MKNINAKFNETVHLCVISDKKLLLVDQIETTRPIKIHVDSGTTLHPHASAFGKAILAHLDDEQLKPYFDGDLEKLTQNTITEKDELNAQLRKIQKTNIAYDMEEYMDGVVCAGSAVFDLSNRAVAAIGLVAPRYRVKDGDLEMIAEYIHTQAEIVSKSLGYNM